MADEPMPSHKRKNRQKNRTRLMFPMSRTLPRARIQPDSSRHLPPDTAQTLSFRQCRGRQSAASDDSLPELPKSM